MDNKGQLLIHMFSIFDLIKKQQLGYNIKFIIEGNEETGSAKMENFVKTHHKLLTADFVIISDGSLANNRPTIEVGLRGILNTTLTLTTGKKELHSGMFGGYAPNVILESSKLLAKLYAKNNKVNIPGFYQEVKSISASEKKQVDKIKLNFNQYYKLSGSKGIVNEDENNFYLQTGLRPTVQVTGILAGYNGEGYKTSIPNQIQIKLNFRLVVDQKPRKIIHYLKNFLEANLPDYVDYQLDYDLNNATKAIKLGTDNDFNKKISLLLQKIYHKQVVYKYVGGTIPLIVSLKKYLNSDIILVPLANEDCNMHGVNENFKIDLIKKGVVFCTEFFSRTK